MEIDELLGKLNPKTAASFRRASSITNETLLTPSLGINTSMRGLGYGRITTLWGNRAAGKSLFCLGLAAEAQKNDKSVAWIDAEKNFDPEWAARHGVDADQMLISSIGSLADMADASHDLIRNGVDLMVIDSVSALLPQSYFSDGEMKQLADTGQIGTFSKNLGQALNMINNVNEDTAVVLISQVRNKISTYGASKTLMGGEAIEFFSSTILKLWSNPNLKEDYIGEVTVGDMILKRPVGRPVEWTIEKNRGPGMHHANRYDMYFAGDFVGIDTIDEIITYGVEYGVIRKSGNWLAYGNMEKGLNGAKQFRNFLVENPLVYSEIYDAVLKKAAA